MLGHQGRGSGSKASSTGRSSGAWRRYRALRRADQVALPALKANAPVWLNPRRGAELGLGPAQQACNEALPSGRASESASLAGVPQTCFQGGQLAAIAP